jgi:argininosuccinate lyase
LSKVALQLAQQVDPRFTAAILGAADAVTSVARKKNAGGTGWESIDQQIQFLRERAHQAESLAAHIPRLDALLSELKEAPL